MRFSIITLFPETLEPILNSSILKRAQKKGLVEFEMINLRDFGEGPHQVVDDRPYGGGAGMVLKADVLAKAVKRVQGSGVRGQKNEAPRTNSPLFLSENASFQSLHPWTDSPRFSAYENKEKITVPSTLNPVPLVILTSASGIPYDQQTARRLSEYDHIILVCGHYEGVDQRFIDKYVDEEISIGDYVLTGGEIPVIAIVDSITRLIPGVLVKEDATLNESFENGLLEYPHYTRPDEFEGEKVPDVLSSGHHGEVDKWRQQKSEEKTKKVRPDLLK